MTPAPQSPPAPFAASGFALRATRVVLAGLASLVALARLRTWNEPFERDITTYAVFGHELLQGRALYADLWDNKPPGIFAVYAAAEWLAGYGSGAIYAINVLSAVVALCGVYAAAAAAGQARRGLWAAAAFAVLSGNLALQANQPNVEIFLNACLVWLLALLLRANERLGLRGAATAGALLFLAMIFKTYAAVAGLLVVVHALVPPRSTRRSAALREAALAAAVVLAGWLGVAAYFGATGRFEDLFEVLVVHGRHYARDPLGNVLSGFLTWGPAVLPLVGLLAASVLGLLLGGAERRRIWLLLAAYAVAVHVMVCMPGRYYPHYFQLWLPLVAVGFGVLLREIGCRLPAARPARSLETPLAALVVGGLLLAHLPSLVLAPEEWSRRKYGDDKFVLVKALAGDLEALLRPEESFFHLGAESGLYFYSRRSPPTGPMVGKHYLYGPLREKLQRRMIGDLERAAPELIVIKRNFFDDARASGLPEPLLDWLVARYRPPADALPIARLFPCFYARLGDRESPFFFLVRRGGGLEARVSGRAAPASAQACHCR